MRLGEAGAAAGDDVGDSGAGDGDRVHVAFDEDREIALAESFFRAIEMVEDGALCVDRRFGRIHVLRRVVTHGASAESDYLAGFIAIGNMMRRRKRS